MKRIFVILLFILMAVTMPKGVWAQEENVNDYITVDVEAGIVTIDGTLGGKATATEDDITALVEKLEECVDNGITTIIVPGSKSAIITVGNVTVTAIGEAIYRLSGSDYYDENNPYNGKIDLILPDVTEIVAMEFYAAFALNSITLPKVTTIGDGAFCGCLCLEELTFGSVVASINQSNTVVFHRIAEKIDGCDLVLNCGQLQTEDTYKPDLENNVWFKPSWGGNVTWKSIALTHDDSKHTTGADNGDGTHSFECTVCGTADAESHSGGTATCSHPAECEYCRAEYGECNLNNHRYDGGICVDCGRVDTNTDEIVINDGYYRQVVIENDAEVERLIYNRNLSNMEWNSLFVPFEIDVTEDLLQDYEVAYVNDMHSADTDDNGEIDEIEMEIVKIKEGVLNANHPYFIRAKNEHAVQLQLSYENVTLHAVRGTTLNCSSIYMDYAIVGIYKLIEGKEFAAMPADCYYAISIEGGWWQIAEDSYLNPFRVYLAVTARDGSPVKISDEAMRSIRFREKGEGTTVIENIKTESGKRKTENGEIEDVYDMQGRKVETPAKGIYIINGKKVFVKGTYSKNIANCA